MNHTERKDRISAAMAEVVKKLDLAQDCEYDYQREMLAYLQQQYQAVCSDEYSHKYASEETE